VARSERHVSAISLSIIINTGKSLIIRSCSQSILFTQSSRHFVITLPRGETKKSKDNPSFARFLQIVPGPTIRTHQKKLHSDTLVYHQCKNIWATWSLQALKPSSCRNDHNGQKCRFYFKGKLFSSLSFLWICTAIYITQLSNRRVNQSRFGTGGLIIADIINLDESGVRAEDEGWVNRCRRAKRR